MFRAQPGGATFAVSIAKHAARHCARTKKHCSTPNYTGVARTPIFTTVHFKHVRILARMHSTKWTHGCLSSVLQCSLYNAR